MQVVTREPSNLSSHYRLEFKHHETRPLADYLPNSILGTQLPENTPNQGVEQLVDIEGLIGKEIYGLDNDHWQDLSINSFFMDQNGEYTLSGDHIYHKGDYSFANDNSVRLEVDGKIQYFATLVEQNDIFLS